MRVKENVDEPKPKRKQRTTKTVWLPQSQLEWLWAKDVFYFDLPSNILIKMKIAIFICLMAAFVFDSAIGVIIDKPACGPKFYCPDHCNISWRNACPHNCFCKPIKYCPLVTCPASYPVCLVFTMNDGCQSCACSIPFAFIKANQSVNDAGVTYGDAGNLRNVQEGDNITDEGGNDAIVARKMMCTIENMNRIDLCLRNTLAFHKYARQRKRDDQPITINPMVLLGDRDMKALCRLFTNAVNCIGDQIYEDCRRDHPDLSEMDSLLSYACGPKSHHFFQHFSCIADVHKENPRVQMCEDLFVNALIVIQESPDSVDKKQIQKCRALNWFLNCGRPNVYRYCSPAAAKVYAESLMSATAYMAPECHPDFENGTIAPRPREKQNITLFQPKETLNCTMSHQFAVFALFDNLYNQIRSLTASASPVFPTVYSFKNTTLHEKCQEFQFALYHLPVDIRLRCYRNFEVFDQVYGAFAYPCGPQTQGVFFQHFDCLKSLRGRKDVVECEDEAVRHLADPSVDQCEVYDLLVRCVHRIVDDKCGYDAWDAHFQLLSLSVRRYVPECTLTPVYRPPALLL